VDFLSIKDIYRSATKEEMNQIYKLLIELIEYGISGLSFGLEYDPGITKVYKA